MTAKGDSAPGHWTFVVVSLAGFQEGGRAELVSPPVFPPSTSHLCIIPCDFQWELSALRDGRMELMVLLVLLWGWGGGALCGFH